MLNDFFTSLFGGDLPKPGVLYPSQVVCRATAMYIAAILLIRIGKSRLLSRATPVDGVLTFVLGAVFGGAIVGTASMSVAVIAAASLIATHWVFTALAYRFKSLGMLLKGEAYVLVSDGQINWENVANAHISEDDLLEELRLSANITDVSQVKIAIKERSGTVGVVRKTPPS